MSKTSKAIERIEQAWGKPIVDVLMEAYNRLGNQAAVADELGVSQGTISLWLRMHGLRVMQVWVVEETYTLTSKGKEAASAVKEGVKVE